MKTVKEVSRITGVSVRTLPLLRDDIEARNTTASLLLAAGVDPFIITQILGHTNITTSQGYMRVAESQKREAIESVAGLLGL